MVTHDERDDLIGHAMAMSCGDPTAARDLLVSALLEHIHANALSPAGLDHALRTAAERILSAMTYKESP